MSQNKEKFSQGPWSCAGRYIKSSEKNCFGGNTQVCRIHEQSSESKEIANGLLISAAPEMYRVLSGICWEKSAQCCNYAPESCNVCSIRKALKKARGEE